MNKQLLVGLLVLGSFAAVQSAPFSHKIFVHNDTKDKIQVKKFGGTSNEILLEIKPGDRKEVDHLDRSALGPFGANKVEKKFLLDMPGNRDVVIGVMHDRKLQYGANGDNRPITYVKVDRGALNTKTSNADNPSRFDLGNGRIAKVTWKIEGIQYPDVTFTISPA